MATDTLPIVLVWGDSLSAAYGIPVEKGWVHLLKTELTNKAHVINGSISGETTAGGLSRLPEALKTHQPQYVILELGGNDGLRGIAPDVIKNNLNDMIKLIQTANAKVILIGMKIPPNYGINFTEKFETIYKDLAATHKLALVPFLLEGVAENWDAMQADGVHPTASAQPLLLKNVWAILKDILPTPTTSP